MTPVSPLPLQLLSHAIPISGSFLRFVQAVLIITRTRVSFRRARGNDPLLAIHVHEQILKVLKLAVLLTFNPLLEGTDSQKVLEGLQQSKNSMFYIIFCVCKLLRPCPLYYLQMFNAFIVLNLDVSITFTACKSKNDF